MSYRKYIISFIVIILILGAVVTVGAAEPLKIVYNAGVAPLKYEDESKQPAGLFPDLWRLWAEKTGREIQFIKTDLFDESLDFIKSGQADLHAGLFKTAEREEFLEYSNPILELNYYLYTHPTIKTISDIKDSSGLIVGLQAGGYTEKWVRERVPADRIVVYPSFSELFDAAIKGEVKVFISTRISLLYYLNLNRMANIFSCDSKKPLFSQVYYTAALKGKTRLIEAVDKGLEAIGREEREQLENKWIVKNQRNIPVELAGILTEEERLFLAKTGTLQVHNESDWAPFNFNVNGVPKGFSIDYMDLLAKKCGLEIEYINGPSWNEFLEMTKTGGLDIMLNIAKSPERQEYLEFTPSYITMTQVLYTRKDFPQVQSINDLYGKRFAMPKGFYLQEILKNHPQVQIVEVADTSAAIYAVSTGKADALFDLMPVVNYLSKQLQITNLKVGGDMGLVEGKPIPLHIAVPKDKAILSRILKKGMDLISEDEISALHQKWLGNLDSASTQLKLAPEERAWVEQRKKPVIVGAEMDWPPFDFVKNNRATGYSNELVRLAAGKVGLPVEFIHGYPWAELVEKFKAGEINVLPAIYLTPERQKYIAFTTAYVGNPSVLVVHEERSNIKTVADLKGLKVAIVSGFATADIMQDRYPDIEQLSVKNVEEGLKAVSLNRADAFIGSLGVITHIMETVIIPDIQIVGEIMLKTQEETELHMGVLKENTILLEILQKGLDAVTSEERRELLLRWIPTAVAAEKDRKRVELTAGERRWLREHEKLRLGDEFSRPPFSFLDQKKHFAGIASSYAEVVSERLGIEFEPVTGLTWAEVLEKLNSGEIDVLPAVVRTRERERILNFTKPYISLPMVVATKKEGLFVDSLDDLAGKKVGVVEGSITQELLAMDYPKLTLMKYPSLGEGLASLDKGKLTAFVDNLGSIAYIIEKSKLDRIKISAPTNYSFDLSFGVRKDRPELVNILDKALDTIDERERTAIKNTWMALEVKYGIDAKTVFLWVTPFAVSVLLIIAIFVAWNRRLGTEITRRKTAELEHQAGERKLAAMSQAVDDALVMIDSRGKVRFWNQAAGRLFGYSAEEAMGLDFHEIAAPEELREKAKEGIRCFAESGRGIVFESNLETTAINRNNETFPVEVSLSSFQMDEKWFAVGTVRDISERKQAEEALKESEERVRKIVDSVNIGIILIDPENMTIVDANPVAAKMIGARREDIIGSTCHRFICPTEEGNCPITNQGQAVDNAERILLTADSGMMPVLKTVVPVKLGGKEYLLESFVDLTERKKAEEEVRRHLEDLERFNKLVIGRELKMIQLKEEINGLLANMGREVKYKIVE